MITKQDIIDRILHSISLPLQPLDDVGTLGCDVTGEPIADWVVGVDPEPPDAEQRGPPDEAYFVDPPTFFE